MRESPNRVLFVLRSKPSGLGLGDGLVLPVRIRLEIDDFRIVWVEVVDKALVVSPLGALGNGTEVLGIVPQAVFDLADSWRLPLPSAYW